MLAQIWRYWNLCALLIWMEIDTIGNSKGTPRKVLSRLNIWTSHFSPYRKWLKSGPGASVCTHIIMKALLTIDTRWNHPAIQGWMKSSTKCSTAIHWLMAQPQRKLLGYVRIKLEGLMMSGIVTKQQLLCDFIIKWKRAGQIPGSRKEDVSCQVLGRKMGATLTGSLFRWKVRWLHSAVNAQMPENSVHISPQNDADSYISYHDKNERNRINI